MAAHTTAVMVYSGGAPPAKYSIALCRKRFHALTPMQTPDMTSTDEQLMQQMRERRPEALSRLYDQYSSLVYSVAMRVLRDPAAAEDVMQEVFLKLWQQPECFTQQRGSLCGWLAVVARNRAIDRVRGARHVENIEDLQLCGAGDLGSEAERAIMIEKVRTVIDGMSAEQRQAMEMAFFEGRTHSEIAEQTGQPLGTVKTRIRSALSTIRKVMEPDA